MDVVDRRLACRQPVGSGFRYAAGVRGGRWSERLLITATRLVSLSVIHAPGVESPSERLMCGANIYSTGNGWIYEVWFQGRVIVIGCCATLEAATRAATNV